MTERTEILLCVIIDILAINAAFAFYFIMRIESGIIAYAIEPEFLLPMIVLYLYWLALFSISGLYRSWYARSRMDELFLLLKVTLIGTLALFFLILWDDAQTGGETSLRLVILFYWGTLFTFTASGRLALRFVEKKYLGAGKAGNKTLIIGWSDEGRAMCDMILRYPALGYRPAGFVSLGAAEATDYKGIPVLGTLSDLPGLIPAKEIREVLIGLQPTQHDRLVEIIRLCGAYPVGIKIRPDLYNIVTGQARISSLHGELLMDVRPELLKPWERVAKRLLDIAVSSMVLVAGLPLWILVAAGIELTSRGPVFYKQERVGRDGKMFKMIKFRSMIADAEKKSGPVWAGKNDPRVTAMGRLMRRTHIDEIPQFINVLTGDMSLVGPRPERPFFVEQFTREIPLYSHRLRVRPGITGWAQIKYKYDQSIDDVRKKLEHDLFYIENMSWRLDVIILFNTVFSVLRGKGHA